MSIFGDPQSDYYDCMAPILNSRGNPAIMSAEVESSLPPMVTWELHCREMRRIKQERIAKKFVGFRFKHRSKK